MYDEPGVDADAHEWNIYSMRARLRQLSIDQGRCTPRSPQWHAIQDEIDGLTGALREYELVMPELQRDEYVARRSMGVGGVFAVGTALLAGLTADGQLSAWWLWPLVVLMGVVALHQLGYAAYRWFR